MHAACACLGHVSGHRCDCLAHLLGCCSAQTPCSCPSATSLRVQGPEQPSITIGMHGAVGFVVAASAMLLLLFFFLSKWLAYLLVSLMHSNPDAL